MKLICKNNICEVYDDGDNYRVKTIEGEEKLISKEKDKPYPLSCVLKWGMEAIDIEYLNKLDKELEEWYKRRND